jgi:hypothetical protein
MPIIRQAQCERCDYTSDVFPSEYGAVFVDAPSADAPSSVVGGGAPYGATGDARIATQSDPRLVVLAHPLEQSILDSTGQTWTSLTRAGRYVRIRRVACRDCGTLFEIRRLACPPIVGCVAGLAGGIIGVGVGVGVGVWAGKFWVGVSIVYGLAFGLWMVAELAAWTYLRVRFRERARALGTSRCCPHCGSNRYARVESRRVFPCPRCSERSMRIRTVGMS